MNIKNALHVILFAAMCLLAGACKDVWEDHTEVGTDGVKLNLAERIAAEPTLSKFYGYLQQTNLDKELASGKVYTVWAPNNVSIDALLATQAPGYLSDSATLSQFVRYYITDLKHPVTTNTSTERIRTLNGFSTSFRGTKYESADIILADINTKNGLLHVLGSAFALKETAFTYSKTLTANSLQLAAMADLDTVKTNPDGISRSSRWNRVVRLLSSPDSAVTYFVLNNTAYQAELDKIKPYYTTTATIHPEVKQDYIRTIAMLENLTVSGIYTQDQLPDTLISITGVKIPIKQSAIVSSYQTNNGMVYVLNSLPYRIKDRIREFKIEGERTTGILYRNNGSGVGNVGNDKAGNTFRRYKLDSLGIPYRDIEVYNHAQPEFFIQYNQGNVHSVKYDVYARVTSGTFGDPQQIVFTQRYGVPNPTNSTLTNVVFTHVIPLRRYREFPLGQFTMAEFGTLQWRLLAANSNAINVSTLILDYFRFVPVVPN